MLILSRRADERIRFPSLGITVHVLKLSPSVARIGIDAPPDVQILREELGPALPASAGEKQSRHALANALNRATLAIELSRKLWERGRAHEADATLQKALDDLAVLDQRQRPAPAATNVQPRTLIVEDDPNERQLLASLLGMNGCDCATAADGIEALDFLHNSPRPDIVLLDMSMPRCDGPETLRRIRSDTRFQDLTIFSLSSTNPRELQIPLGPSGVNAWFPKPLDASRLCHAIRQFPATCAIAN